MANFAHVEKLIHSALEDTAPAISLVVYQNGKSIIERAYGYIDPDTKLYPTQLSTPFDLASITKLFTVTAFLKQVSDGLVNLNTPVVDIIPELGHKKDIRPIEGGQNPHTLERLRSSDKGFVDAKQITFQHLLTHTSGLASWRDLFLNVGSIPSKPYDEDPITHEIRLKNALNLIGSYPFVCKIDEKVNYSDLGLILLGTAVARIDKAANLAESIYTRVSASVTYNPRRPEICPPTEDDQRWRKWRCQGEVHDENAACLGGIAGHAGLFGTAQDVAQLGLQWLYAINGKDPNLSSEIAKLAIKNHRDDRGLGWVIRSAQGSSSGQYFSPNSFGHTGFTGTSLWIDPKRELVVSLMTNRVYHGRDPKAISTFRPKLHDAIVQWVDTQQGKN